MKIIETYIDQHSVRTIEESGTGCCNFILFKSLARVSVNGVEFRSCSGSVLIFGSEKVAITPLDENSVLQYDYVSFAADAADIRYIAELELPLGKPFEIPDDTAVRSIIRCTAVQSFGSEKRENEFSESALRMIFLSVSEQYCSRKAMPSSEIPHYKELYALRSRIYADPVKNWSIDRICSQLGLSSAYFHRLYYAAFGTTCRQDVINGRLALAEKLLLSTDKTVGSIAEQCGYDSDSYFMRQFKQQKGYTPSEYRRRFSESASDLIGGFSDMQ